MVQPELTCTALSLILTRATSANFEAAAITDITIADHVDVGRKHLPGTLSKTGLVPAHKVPSRPSYYEMVYSVSQERQATPGKHFSI